MPFNTRNPIPSGDLRDLDDNARNIDTWANDKTKLSHPDRFGVERYTWHGIEQKAQLDLADAVAEAVADATADAEQARDQAIAAKLAAMNAAASSGITKYADTKAILTAGVGTTYVNGDVVLVFADESQSGASAIYKIEANAAVFKTLFDQTRADLLSFTGTISADAEWSDVPAHSDPALDAQAQAMVNRTAFIYRRMSNVEVNLDYFRRDHDATDDDTLDRAYESALKIITDRPLTLTRPIKIPRNGALVGAGMHVPLTVAHSGDILEIRGDSSDFYRDLKNLQFIGSSRGMLSGGLTNRYQNNWENLIVQNLSRGIVMINSLGTIKHGNIYNCGQALFIDDSAYDNARGTLFVDSKHISDLWIQGNVCGITNAGGSYRNINLDNVFFQNNVVHASLGFSGNLKMNGCWMEREGINDASPNVMMDFGDTTITQAVGAVTTGTISVADVSCWPYAGLAVLGGTKTSTPNMLSGGELVWFRRETAKNPSSTSIQIIARAQKGTLAQDWPDGTSLMIVPTQIYLDRNARITGEFTQRNAVNPWGYGIQAVEQYGSTSGGFLDVHQDGIRQVTKAGFALGSNARISGETGEFEVDNLKSSGVVVGEDKYAKSYRKSFSADCNPDGVTKTALAKFKFKTASSTGAWGLAADVVATCVFVARRTLTPSTSGYKTVDVRFSIKQDTNTTGLEAFGLDQSIKNSDGTLIADPVFTVEVIDRTATLYVTTQGTDSGAVIKCSTNITVSTVGRNIDASIDVFV